MTGGLRGVACGGAWAFAAACGPTYVDGPFGTAGGSGEGDGAGTHATEGSGAATSSASATATATATATETATETVTETVTDTVTETVTDTVTDTIDGTGAPADADAISMVGCQDDGTIALLVEVSVETTIEDCMPPVGLDPSTLLLVGIEDWDGQSGGYVVDGNVVSATYDLGPFTGTLTVEVSTPYHPSWLEYNLAGDAAVLMGMIDLETCSYVEEPPCEVSTTSD
ncbi:MAG TPA: hypothetical protein VFG69_03700 [Nannocystaceae bacterium]|nr:hypothetical protein [Nannocystaceae bacterium]